MTIFLLFFLYMCHLEMVGALADKHCITAVSVIRKWRKARLGLNL